MRNMKNLNEELNIEDADFLGSGYGYDVYHVRTWSAAQQFVADNQSQEPAGVHWTTSEEIFNNNLGNPNSHYKLIFFAHENTNKVSLAMLTNMTSTVTFRLNGQSADSSFNCRENCSCSVQTVSGEGSNVSVIDIDPQNPDDCFPFSIVDEFMLNNVNQNLCELGLLTSNDGTKILGNYRGLINPEREVRNLTLPSAITAIGSAAFSHYIAQRISIPSTVKNVDSNAFENFNGIVQVPFTSESSLPEGWKRDWRGSGGQIEYAQSEASAIQGILKYKKVGDHIVILGLRKPETQTSLDIPSMIDGLPVTEISPFAFSEDPVLQKVMLPETIKIIGKAAFYNCRSLILYLKSKPTIYTDGISGIRFKRDLRPH